MTRLLIASLSVFCVLLPPASRGTEPAPDTVLSVRRPINIEVTDQRPDVETIANVGYKTGFAYTAWGAKGQCVNFAKELGDKLKKDKAIPDYINVNEGGASDVRAITFTLVVAHWYARWPIRFEKDPVLVEGLFEATLRVSSAGKTIYEHSYSTGGIPQFTSTAGVNTRNTKEYFTFVENAIAIKGNDLLTRMVGDIASDLTKQWEQIVEAEQI